MGEGRRDLEQKMRASVTQEAMVEAKKEAEKRAQQEMQVGPAGEVGRGRAKGAVNPNCTALSLITYW